MGLFLGTLIIHSLGFMAAGDCIGTYRNEKKFVREQAEKQKRLEEEWSKPCYNHERQEWIVDQLTNNVVNCVEVFSPIIGFDEVLKNLRLGRCSSQNLRALMIQSVAEKEGWTPYFGERPKSVK